MVLDFAKMNQETFDTYFKYGASDKWDQNNLQVYRKENVIINQDGLWLRIEKMSENDKQEQWDKFLKDCAVWEIQRKLTPWIFWSGAIISKGYFDVLSEGRIIVPSNIPQGQVGMGIWLVDEWHEKDKNTDRKGNYYFEADFPEAGKNFIQKHWCLFFSMHDGLSINQRNLSVTKIHGRFDETVLNELEWDGEGNFTFSLDGIPLKHSFVELNPDVRPSLLITYAITPQRPDQNFSMTTEPMNVKGIYFKGNYVPKKTW
uniref:Uncharacterized protein n=1 Tax=viral metagenome TaxID=1070528 RepID=A0A6M3KD72_9ZZZZ